MELIEIDISRLGSSFARDLVHAGLEGVVAALGKIKKKMASTVGLIRLINCIETQAKTVFFIDKIET